MNEQQLGDRIRHLLNQGPPLDAGIRARLAAAREQALERRRTAPAPALAWAEGHLGREVGWGDLSLRILLPLILLTGGLAGIYAWERNQRIAEVEEIDAQLLTDDLPVEAYLDRGFQNWLKKRAIEQR